MTWEESWEEHGVEIGRAIIGNHGSSAWLIREMYRLGFKHGHDVGYKEGYDEGYEFFKEDYHCDC